MTTIIIATSLLSQHAHTHPGKGGGTPIPPAVRGEQKDATRKATPVARLLPNIPSQPIAPWRPCVVSTYHEYEGEHTTASGEPFKDEGYTCAVYNRERRKWMLERYTVVLWWLGKTARARCNDVFVDSRYKNRIDVSEGVVYDLTGQTSGLFPDKGSDLKAFFYLMPEDKALKGAVNKKLVALRASKNKARKGEQ
jgi:hypothetical protein